MAIDHSLAVSLRDQEIGSKIELYMKGRRTMKVYPWYQASCYVNLIIVLGQD